MNRSIALIMFTGIAFGTLMLEQAASEEPESLARLTVHMRAKLKAEAVSRKSDKHAKAVVELCDFYAQLHSDTRYTQSETLRGLAARVRRRLLDVEEDIRLQMKRDRIVRPEDMSAKLEAVDRYIAQQRSDSVGGLTYEVDKAEDAKGGFGPGGIPDNGWMLVELIERTVDPNFWSSQGGPGVAVYYPLQRALVLRATTRVHEDVQALLQALGGLPR